MKNALLKAALCSNEVNSPAGGVLEGLVLALSNCPKGKGDYSCLYSYFAEVMNSLLSFTYFYVVSLAEQGTELDKQQTNE